MYRLLRDHALTSHGLTERRKWKERCIEKFFTASKGSKLVNWSCPFRHLRVIFGQAAIKQSKTLREPFCPFVHRFAGLICSMFILKPSLDEWMAHYLGTSKYLP